MKPEQIYQELKELAEKLNTQVLGLLLGSKVESIAKEAISYGCDIVYVMDIPCLNIIYLKYTVKPCMTCPERLNRR